MRHRTRGNHADRGFTLVELLMSVLVVGVLIALLIVGLRFATRLGRSGAERQNVVALRVAAEQFRQEFGFAPPLVRDLCPDAILQTRVEKNIWTSVETRRMAVYDVNDTRTGDPVPDRVARYVKILRREEPVPAPPGDWGRETEWYDPRYSENTLAYYLVGALDDPVYPDQAGTEAEKTPIDGVRGPGFLEPNRDGSFKVPSALYSGDSDARRRVPRQFGAFFTPGTSVRMYVDVSGSGPNGTPVELRDRNNVAYRYYRWLRDDGQPARQGGETDEAYFRRWLNVPIIVGDPSVDVRLREAEFAIVAAGPDGVFGDEPIEFLRAKLGMGGAAELRVRLKAAEDNIVEVGR